MTDEAKGLNGWRDEMLLGKGKGKEGANAGDRTEGWGAVVRLEALVTVKVVKAVGMVEVERRGGVGPARLEPGRV